MTKVDFKKVLNKKNLEKQYNLLKDLAVKYAPVAKKVCAVCLAVSQKVLAKAAVLAKHYMVKKAEVWKEEEKKIETEVENAA